MTVQKRWDHYGRYKTDNSNEIVVQAAKSVGVLPISFGDRTRALCVPTTGVAVTILATDAGEQTGVLALRINKERGVYRELSSADCRSMAEGLLRMADVLDARIAEGGIGA